MKRNVRCVYIDGMEKSGKTSVMREMRKFFKNKNKDLHEINGTNIDKLNIQNVMLEDDEKSIILKENSLLSVFYKELKENRGIGYIETEYPELIRKEQDINHKYGAVHFFLIPEDTRSIAGRYVPDELPNYMPLLDFYKGINLYTITQGLDIRLIPFNEHDKIYDIRDKILKILDKDYNI